MKTSKLKLLILATFLPLFSITSYSQAKEEPLEIVTSTYSRVLVQANKDGPRVAIGKQEAEASATGKETSHCKLDSQSSSARGYAKTSASKLNDLALEVNLRSVALVRGGYFLTCQQSDPKRFPCDTGGCVGTTRNAKTASANVSSSARVEFRLPAADSPGYGIKVSKSGSSSDDVVATLTDTEGKEIKLNESEGEDPVLSGIGGGRYYLILDLPAVANKKGQEQEDIDRSATVRVQLTARSTPESAKSKSEAPKSSEPESPKSTSPESPKNSETETPKSEPEAVKSKSETPKSKSETPKSEPEAAKSKAETPKSKPEAAKSKPETAKSSKP